jgi:DNA-binding transcriptional ArsR family regulator
MTPYPTTPNPTSLADTAAAQTAPEPRLDLPAPDVEAAAATAALISDRTRAGILRMLADGPLCVCELAAALGERQNNVSMHLARLRDAGLVRAVRHSGDARWMFYERDDERCAAAAATLSDLLR